MPRTSGAPLGPPQAAITVTGPDAYGDAPAVGVGVRYARNDHNHGLPAAPGGGGGTTPLTPAALPPVAWALVVPENATVAPAWTYDGTWPAPATTVTETGNGVLTIDSGSPALGDRVVVVDQWNNYFQTFIVTDLGSATTPWVLTATADDITQFWAVEITGGSVYVAGYAYSGKGGTAIWYGSVASGNGSVASGAYSTASGLVSTASGA